MTLGKFNNSGVLTFASTTVLYDVDLNTTFKALPPIGTICAWAKTMTSVPILASSCWVQCDGQTLSDANSPLNGVVIPNLNSTNLFLRGNTTSGGTGGALTHSHGTSGPSAYVSKDYFNVAAGSDGAHTHTSDTIGNTPPYIDIVWIVRVR